MKFPLAASYRFFYGYIFQISFIHPGKQTNKPKKKVLFFLLCYSL